MANSKKEKTLPVEQVDPMFDLTNRIVRSVVAVIDTVVQRGGFRGEELSTIGQLRDQCVQAAQMCEAYHSAREEE